MSYQAKWPQLFVVSESSPNKTISGYSKPFFANSSPRSTILKLCGVLVMGKAEGKDENWHGHVTAVTVAPEFRRLGLAKTFMKFLERVSDEE